MKKFLYVHGGPGLNSYPESQLLKPIFESHNHEIVLWNEPKSFSSKNYYAEMVDNLKDFILSQGPNLNIISHSFGSYLVLDLISKTDLPVNSLCFVSPALDLEQGDKNILNVGLEILKKTNTELSKQLETKIQLFKKNKTEQNKIDALLLAFQSGYFSLNFCSEENFKKYFGLLINEHEFRLNDFLKIKPTIAPLKPQKKKKSIKSIAIFGAQDPIFKYENEMKVLNKFIEKTNVKIFPNISHYPHIESQHDFYYELLAHI
ncbi:MAG: alpha/beta hydrolase [Bacteriovoracaceae bacterium]|nr:alpha/beta hydrolase [Bacteriovoracaceae bacterium]